MSASFWFDRNLSSEDGYFITNYLRDGDNFIDIGANIGYLTMVGAKKVGRTGQVISIEPHPRTFNFLSGNIDLNHFTNIKAYNIAIGNENGKLHFSDSKSDEQNFITKRGPIEVEIKRLDDLFTDTSVELLKIDTEGYELSVLTGAPKTLSKIKVVYLETYKKHFDRYNYQGKDILDILIKNGFRVFRFLEKDKLQEINSSYCFDMLENIVAVRDVDFLRSRLNKLEILEI
jgi:FkbM family methyltransferase